MLRLLALVALIAVLVGGYVLASGGLSLDDLEENEIVKDAQEVCEEAAGRNTRLNDAISEATGYDDTVGERDQNCAIPGVDSDLLDPENAGTRTVREDREAQLCDIFGEMGDATAEECPNE